MGDLEFDEAWLTSSAHWLCHFEVLESVDSTNSQARRHAEAGHCGHYLCVANQQLQGRGRLGRTWVSEPDNNIYASLLWKVPDTLQARGLGALQGLSLVVGLSVATVLADFGLSQAKVKWPNDVKVGGEKIAGILIEVIHLNGDQLHVIVGLGVNVHQPKKSPDISQPWTSMAAQLPNKPLRRSVVLANILDRMNRYLSQFVDEGWSSFGRIWAENDALCGQEVTVQEGGDLLLGRAVGVDEQGALLFIRQGADTPYAIHSGDVTVRQIDSMSQP